MRESTKKLPTDATSQLNKKRKADLMSTCTLTAFHNSAKNERPLGDVRKIFEKPRTSPKIRDSMMLNVSEKMTFEQPRKSKKIFEQLRKSGAVQNSKSLENPELFKNATAPDFRSFSQFSTSSTFRGFCNYHACINYCNSRRTTLNACCIIKTTTCIQTPRNMSHQHSAFTKHSFMKST